MTPSPRNPWIPAVLTLGLLLAWTHRQFRTLQRDVGALRLEVEAAPAVSVPTASGAPDGIQAELVALRGELASLRRAVEARPPDGITDGSGTAGVPAPAPPVLPPHFRQGWVDPAGLPGPVLEAFHQQLGDLAIDGAHVKRAEGHLYFSVETQLPDGRAMELSVDETGTLRHRHLETPFETLDPRLQQAAAGVVGDTPIRRVDEVYEDGQIRYRVHAKGPDRAVGMVLAPDGTVIRTEIERPEPRP